MVVDNQDLRCRSVGFLHHPTPCEKKFSASDIWNIEIWDNGVKVVVRSTPMIFLPIDLCGGACR